MEITLTNFLLASSSTPVKSDDGNSSKFAKSPVEGLCKRQNLSLHEITTTMVVAWRTADFFGFLG